MELTNISLSEYEILRLLISIFVLLFSAISCGYLFQKIGFPKVVGEIMAGILLGPSGLGFLNPEISSNIFNSFPEQGKILCSFYWLGLIFLMLAAGFEVSHSSTSTEKKSVVCLIISATVLPVVGGILYYNIYDFTPYMGTNGNNVSICIILCIAISVTSLPVISKIFIDLRIINTLFAKIVLMASMFQDIILWAALNVAINHALDTQINIMSTILLSFLFLAVCLGISTLLNRYQKIVEGFVSQDSPVFYIVVIVTLLIVIISGQLRINLIFGALMAGLILNNFNTPSFKVGKTFISRFSLQFFIPIYFAIVGLKINIPIYLDVGFFLSFLFISSFLEIGSVFIGLRFLKLDWLSRLNFGLAMNTRGGPGIVLATVAFEYSIINEYFFVTLILTAILTSVLSGYWFKYILARGKLLYKDPKSSQT